MTQKHFFFGTDQPFDIPTGAGVLGCSQGALATLVDGRISTGGGPPLNGNIFCVYGPRYFWMGWNTLTTPFPKRKRSCCHRPSNV